MLFILLVVIISYEIYNSRIHIRCEPEHLREDAKITDVNIKSVGFKRSMKYRTTVVFSDGFKYISHLTERDDGFFTYKIIMTPQMKQMIEGEAKAAHLQRLRKYQRDNGISVIDAVEKEVVVASNASVESKMSAEETLWICSVCKRKNLSSSKKCWNCSTLKEN